MIPLNLMNKNHKADFVITGQWANKAYQEASRYGKCNVIASSKDKTFSYIPELDKSKFDPEADYFHICYNNTIYGTRFNELPETGDVPLVADMSSCILSEPVDVSKFGLIYAGAQKNMGPAGLTVVIIREDLIGNAMEMTLRCSTTRSMLITARCTTRLRRTALYPRTRARLDKGNGRTYRDGKEEQAQGGASVQLP